MGETTSLFLYYILCCLSPRRYNIKISCSAFHNETNKKQANIFDLNVLPQEEEEQGLGNLSQVHHAFGEEITLRNDGYDIDLNSKPYLGFYDGPKYDKWDERQKQFFWDFQKLYFPQLFRYPPSSS